MTKRCGAVSQDKWVCAPHTWTQCRNKAHFIRGGLPVCRVHKASWMVAAFDVGAEERPHWREFSKPPKTKATDSDKT